MGVSCGVYVGTIEATTDLMVGKSLRVASRRSRSCSKKTSSLISMGLPMWMSLFSVSRKPSSSMRVSS